MSGVIYKIVNTKTGKYYVGSTINFRQRKYNHLRLLRLQKHHSVYLQRAFDKFGERSFVFIIVEKNISPDKLEKREQDFLNIAKKDKSYNCSFLAYKIEMTKIIREKIGKKTKQRLLDKKNHPLFGTRLSSATRKRISDSLIGRFKGKNSPNFGMKLPSSHPFISCPAHRFGSRNGNYDSTIFCFKNILTGETLNLTKYDFRMRIGCSRNNIRDYIIGKTRSIIKEWAIFPHPHLQNYCNRIERN